MRSSNKIQDAFACIEAGDELKSRTKEFLKTERRQREGRLWTAHPAFGQVIGAVCVLLFLILGAGGYAMLMVPVSCVSIDVNPSIELSLNRLDRVISATAYNEDGEAVLNALSVRGMYYTEAIDSVVESEVMQPYLQEETGLTFTVAADNGQKEGLLLSGIENTSGCRDHGGVGYGADFGVLEEAHANGLSLGKYAAYQMLSQYDDSITAQDCHDMTMSEIQGLIKEHVHGHREEHGGAAGQDHGREYNQGGGNPESPADRGKEEQETSESSCQEKERTGTGSGGGHHSGSHGHR